MITIPEMPGLWDMDTIIVSLKDVLGALAKWAIRQSPYTVPENLELAIIEFNDVWIFDDYVTFSSDLLLTSVRATINSCPTILAWNERKNGRKGMGFCSRFDIPDPDDDFIDLDALTRNMVHDIVLSAQVQKAQDK